MKPEIMSFFFFSMCWASFCWRSLNSLWENWDHCALEMKGHTKGWLLFCWGTFKDHRLIYFYLFSWCGAELSTALQWLPGVSYAGFAYKLCQTQHLWIAERILCLWNKNKFRLIFRNFFYNGIVDFWCEFPFFPSFQGPGTMTWAKPPTMALRGTCSEQLLIIFSVFLSHYLLLNTTSSLLIS